MSQELDYNESLTVLLNNRLQSYADVLLLNGSFVDNLGFGKGKMGIAISLYYYAHYNISKVFEDCADELIDEIYEEINTATPLDFENGLTGIGWGLEYLVRNGFLEGDTDDILKGIDFTLSESLNEYLPEIRAVKKKEIGYDKYQLARNKSNPLDEGNLYSFIKQQTFNNDPFNIPVLINAENYGLFEGIAGEVLLTLRELSKITT